MYIEIIYLYGAQGYSFNQFYLYSECLPYYIHVTIHVGFFIINLWHNLDLENPQFIHCLILRSIMKINIVSIAIFSPLIVDIFFCIEILLILELIPVDSHAY